MTEDDGQDRLALTLCHPLIMVMIASRHRSAITALWDYDAALAQILRTVQEPTLRALRLTWWHDQLDALAGEGPAPAHPLLVSLKEHYTPDQLATLAEFADDWADFAEAEPLDRPAVEAFAVARGSKLFTLSAAILGAAKADALGSCGRDWALADIASHLSDSALVTAIWSDLTQYRPSKGRALPRALSALLALSYRRVQSAGHIHPLREQALLLRFGLIGR